MDLIDPFLTFYQENADHSRADGRQEAEKLFQRQGLIEDFLEGRERADTVLDCIDEHGLDAASYADAVHDAITAIVDCGTVYISNDAGLLLPRGIVL